MKKNEKGKNKSNDVSIFLAGSKELKEERAHLKILANDMSSDAYMQGINVKAFSYDNFNDNQDLYNAFIENNADIFILIIKDGMGVKSKEEFEKAAKSFQSKKHPEIIVFMHETVSNSEEIYNIMEEYVGKQYYAVDYSSIDDLKAKARKRIDWYIKKQVPTMKPSGGLFEEIKAWWNMRHNLLSIGIILEMVLFLILFVVFVRLLTGGNVQSIAFVFLLNSCVCALLLVSMASIWWGISNRKRWGIWSLLVSNLIELFLVCKMSVILHQWRGIGYTKPIYKIFDELGAYIERCDGWSGYFIIIASVMAIQIAIWIILLSLKTDSPQKNQ